MTDTKLIEDKTEIDKIINEKIKGKKLIFTDWYQEGILKRGIEHEKVLEIFPQFDKVTKIEKEKQKFGDMSYFISLLIVRPFLLRLSQKTIKF